MTIEEARKAYYDASASVSSICRQLCFAGIAVVWIFRNPAAPTKDKLDADLLWPIGCLVVSMIFDLGQYTAKTLIWGIYARSREHEQNVHPGTAKDKMVPVWYNAAPLVFFWGKVGACFAGYVFIFALIYNRLIR